MSKGKFALGAIIGAVVGTVAGVLTAPKSGKETRADLKAKADEVAADAKVKAQKVRTKADEVAADAKAKAEEAKAKAEHYKERGESAVHGAVEGAKKGFGKK